jgi:hypothetical protein
MIFKWCGFILLDFFIAAAIFIIYFQQLLFLDKGTEHPTWLNTNPGYPDTIPKLFMMKYAYFALPKDQSFAAMTWVPIKPERPIILKGKPNNARYWSFAFYPSLSKKYTAALPSIDSFKIQPEPDGSYIVTFSPKKAEKNWVNTGSASSGYILMRNYVPVAKTKITLPSVYWGNQLMVPTKEYEHGE